MSVPDDFLLRRMLEKVARFLTTSLSQNPRNERSCLLHRFVKNEWRVLSSQTIGVEFASKIIKVGTGVRRKRIKLQVCPLLEAPIPARKPDDIEATC